jgi:NAD(P)-dependent dehydrogenase (short-subunit alcohol dehydrogenase family)
MLRLADKVAVITGSTSGIGARTAEVFVEHGARVVVAGRRAEQGMALAERLGSNAAFCCVDVSDETQVADLIRFAVCQFGRIDCLFNNAGGPSHTSRVTDIDIRQFDAAISIHVRGALLGMKYAAREMTNQGSGSIINMASINGLRAGMAGVGYSTAKAAVIHMTRDIAIELGQLGIRVNCISPGPIMTGIFSKGRGISPETADQSVDNVRAAFSTLLPDLQAIPRAGTTDDIAYAALFLASDESTLINGHNLVVDGGITAGRPSAVMIKERKSFAQALTSTASS